MKIVCVYNLIKMTTPTNVIPRLLTSARSILTKNQINYQSSLNFKSYLRTINLAVERKCISTSCVTSGSAARAETTSTTQGLSKLQAEELVLRLTSEERNILVTALHEYQSKLIKDEYEGKTTCTI